MSTVGQNPASAVAHRAWNEAQAMLLAAASGGPRTLALLGAAGTGKTWLLDRLVTELRGRGRMVRLERRGDVSPQLPLGAVLLVDEASRLDQPSLERMANQQRGLVILADVPAFARRLDALARPPAAISLPTIDPVEVASFVADWAAAHDFPVAITEAAVARLTVLSGGTARLITQLARAALALADAEGRSEIVGADIDEVASLKTGALAFASPPTVADHPSNPLDENPFTERSAFPIPPPPTEPAPIAAPAPAPAMAAEIAPKFVPAIAPVFPPESVLEIATIPAPRAKPAARRRWRTAATVAIPVIGASVVVAWLGTPRLAAPDAMSVPAPTQLAAGSAAAPGPDPVPFAAASAVPPTLAPNPAPNPALAHVTQAEPVPPAALADAVPPTSPSAAPFETAAISVPSPVRAVTAAPGPVASPFDGASLAGPAPSGAVSAGAPLAGSGAPALAYVPAVPVAARSPALPLASAPLQTPAAPDLPPTAGAALPQSADTAPLTLAEAVQNSVIAPPPTAAAEPARTPSAEPARTPPAISPAVVASLTPTAPLNSPSLLPLTAAAPPEALPGTSSATSLEAPQGAPGLVFIAGPGDTLATLYRRIYRGHRPPPFGTVAAANKQPIRPGTLVVFPPPPGGWAAR